MRQASAWTCSMVTPSTLPPTDTAWAIDSWASMAAAASGASTGPVKVGGDGIMFTRSWAWAATALGLTMSSAKGRAQSLAATRLDEGRALSTAPAIQRWS
jgi:hypothetical protein